MKRTINIANPSQSHTFAGRPFLFVKKIQTKAARPPANLQKSVPVQPGKEIFKNAPHTTEKKGQNKYRNRQIRTSYPADNVDYKAKRMKSTMPQHCISVMRVKVQVIK